MGESSSCKEAKIKINKSFHSFGVHKIKCEKTAMLRLSAKKQRCRGRVRKNSNVEVVCEKTAMSRWSAKKQQCRDRVRKNGYVDV